jgi:hypothetical protein
MRFDALDQYLNSSRSRSFHVIVHASITSLRDRAFRVKLAGTHLAKIWPSLILLVPFLVHDSRRMKILGSFLAPLSNPLAGSVGFWAALIELSGVVS